MHERHADFKNCKVPVGNLVHIYFKVKTIDRKTKKTTTHYSSIRGDNIIILLATIPFKVTNGVPLSRLLILPGPYIGIEKKLHENA